VYIHWVEHTGGMRDLELVLVVLVDIQFRCASDAAEDGQVALEVQRYATTARVAVDSETKRHVHLVWARIQSLRLAV